MAQGVRTQVQVAVKAVGYCRVSTKEQVDDGTSLERQHHLIREHCSSQNLRLLEILTDEGVSGGTGIRSRPGGQRLVDRVDGGFVDCIVTTSLDRLSRSLTDCMQEVEGWKTKGVSLHCLDLDLDLSTASGWATFAIRMTLADFERRLIGERVKAVMDALRADGVPLGSPPYGWDRPGARDEHGRLVWEPDPAELRALAQMCGWREDGWTLQQIADQLLADDVPTKRGGLWRASTVWWALRRFQARAVS